MEEKNTIVKNLLKRHLYRANLSGNILALIFLILGVLCLAPFIYFLTQIPSKGFSYQAILMTFGLGTCLLLAVLTWSITQCQSLGLRKLKKKVDPSVSLVWRLEGEEWSVFISYLFAAFEHSTYYMDHPGRCCYRQSELARYIERGYGHIVILPYHVIIDEMYILNLEKVFVGETKLITIEGGHKVIRIIGFGYLGGMFGPTGYTDLFVPRAFREPEDRLQRLVAFLNQSRRELSDPIRKSQLQQIESLFMHY